MRANEFQKFCFDVLANLTVSIIPILSRCPLHYVTVLRNFGFFLVSLSTKTYLISIRNWENIIFQLNSTCFNKLLVYLQDQPQHQVLPTSRFYHATNKVILQKIKERADLNILNDYFRNKLINRCQPEFARFRS